MADDRMELEEFLDEEVAPGLSRGDAAQARRRRPGRRCSASRHCSAQDRRSRARRPDALTPTFYQWIYGLYPDIPSKINKDYAKGAKLDAKIAPVQGFGIDRFVAEAKKKKSTWDVYVGMTPFVEMGALIESGTIEPWDPVHLEVGRQRPDPVDPRRGEVPGEDLVVPVPPRHHHPGVERRARREGRAQPEQGAEDVGRVHREREEGRQLRGGAVRRSVRRPRLALARADRAHVQHERLHAGRPVRLHERRGGERAPDHEADHGGRAEEHPRGGQGRRRRQHDARRGGLRRPAGGVLRQVPERPDALRRHMARSVGAPHRRAAEEAGRRRWHRVLEHRRGAVQVRARTRSRQPTT